MMDKKDMEHLKNPDIETDDYVKMPPISSTEGYWIPKAGYDKRNIEIDRLKKDNKQLSKYYEDVKDNWVDEVKDNKKLKKENEELIKEISKFRNDHKIMVETLADRIDELKVEQELADEHKGKNEYLRDTIDELKKQLKTPTEYCYKEEDVEGYKKQLKGTQYLDAKEVEKIFWNFAKDEKPESIYVSLHDWTDLAKAISKLVVPDGEVIEGIVNVKPDKNRTIDGKPIDTWHIGTTNIEDEFAGLEDSEIKLILIKK